MNFLKLILIVSILLSCTCGYNFAAENSYSGYSINAFSGNNNNKIFFINSSTGWVVMNKGMLAKTTDGGSTWIEYINDFRGISCLFFSDTLNAWACGKNKEGFRGVLYKTTSGGLDWEQISLPSVDDDLFCIRFFNDTGYIFGHSGSVLKTTDSGKSWGITRLDAKIKKTSWNFGSLFYGSGKDYEGVISYDTAIYDEYYNMVSFVDEKNIHFAGEYGTYYYTTNGGSRWIEFGLPSIDHFRSLCYVNENTGWVSGINEKYCRYKSIVYKTTDRGLSWNGVYSSQVFTADHIYCENKDSAIIYSDFGTFIQTTDGGKEWKGNRLVHQFNGYGISSFFIAPDKEIWAICENNSIITKNIFSGEWMASLGSIFKGLICDVDTLKKKSKMCRNLSQRFDYLLSIKPTYYDDDPIGEIFLSIYRKGNTSAFQLIRAEEGSFLKDTNHNAHGEFDYLEEAFFIGDFNFDGVEDIAIHNGNSGGYGAPTYDVYLYSENDNMFDFSEELTSLASDYQGMFKVYPDKKQLSVYFKSGCCVHWEIFFKIENNKPNPVYEKYVEGDKIMIKKLVNGKWVKKYEEN